MGLTLHVNTDAWKAMVDEVCASFPGLVPVVKGNGYGFGRGWLTHEAIALGAQEVAIGTVFEQADVVAQPVTPIVLTPSLELDSVRVAQHVVLTVASQVQLDHLLAHRPSSTVVVKVMSSTRRHGFAPETVAAAVDQLRNGGATVHSVSIHPGLADSMDARRSEIEQLLASVPGELPVSVSHLDAENYAVLRAEQPSRTFSIRLGSALWHQDKRTLLLRATVLEVRSVRAGDRAGYRGGTVPGDGSVVIVSAGTAHGVVPHANGDSPFHFAQRRLALLEAPHMHVSMVFVPAGDPTPAPGDEVDVQRPLISTQPDRIAWH